MPHVTTHSIQKSLLDTFDPESEHYQGVRDHFSAFELERLDEMRAFPDEHQFTLSERLFLSYALTKVVMTAANPPV